MQEEIVSEEIDKLMNKSKALLDDPYVVSSGLWGPLV